MKEDKARITSALFDAVRLTRAGDGIRSMDYVNDPNSYGREHVIITYSNGYIKRVNVAMDSGAALIRDVMREVN